MQQIGFLKETPVNTPTGLYSINTLTQEHLLYAFSFEEDKPIDNCILKIEENSVNSFWELKAENFFIKAAEDQTIYTHKHGFMSIPDIQLGDEVLTITKKWMRVSEIKEHKICAPVWGITVKYPENIFVKGILVGSANTEMSKMAKETRDTLNSMKTPATVFKSPLKKIARIYAKHGVVFVEGVDGKLTALDVRTAALRARSLNEMPVPPWLAMHRSHLVEQIVKACREAKGQQCDPMADAVTKGVENVLDGKTWEGKELPARTAEDIMFDKFCLDYRAVAEDDIRAIIREIKRGLPIAEAEFLLKGMRDANIRQMTKEQSQQAQKI